MNLVRHELGFSSKTEARFPTKGTCLAIYSRVRQRRAASIEDDPAARPIPGCIAWAEELKQLFAAYVGSQAGSRTSSITTTSCSTGRRCDDRCRISPPTSATRFDHVLVDEYQDTNRLQSSILLALAPGGRGLTVVGDDAQSIYSFRAATVRNILDFPLAFSPKPADSHHARPATIARPNRSWRCRQRASSTLQRERFTKNLWTDRAAERRARCSSRSATRPTRHAYHRRAGAGQPRGRRSTLKQQAVLCSGPHSHSGPLEIELTRRNIPVREIRRPQIPRRRPRQGPARPACASHENPRDRVCRPSGFCKLLPGVGPQTSAQRKILEAICALIAEPGRKPCAEMRPLRPAKTGDDWAAFVEAIEALRSGRSGWPAEIERARLWYEPHLERIHEDATTRQADLLQLEQIAGGYPSRERFLTELTLDPPDATSDQAGVPHLDEDYMILSTIHSAKGQEWKSVFVMNVVDGCIPIDLGAGAKDEIEEERRLLYVAMTRAKDDLHLVVPQRFFTHGQSSTGDRHVYAARTRFIPNNLLKHFQRRAWPLAAPAGTRPASAGPKIDVRAKMRGMWR
jgi:DNA helicase-2/ATP-dependent DNA helicase PcrA